MDIKIYLDYLEKVEVPMNLTIIRQRLNEKFYTRKLPVQNLDVIVESCFNYNEDDSHIVEVAQSLKERFSKIVGGKEMDRPTVMASASVDSLSSLPAPRNHTVSVPMLRITMSSSLTSQSKQYSRAHQVSNGDCIHDIGVDLTRIALEALGEEDHNDDDDQASV